MAVVYMYMTESTRSVFGVWSCQIERERSLKNKALLEKEEYRANIHKLARALRRHQVPSTSAQPHHYPCGVAGILLCAVAMHVIIIIVLSRWVLVFWPFMPDFMPDAAL